ncbi:MAG: hypothetical protein HY815_26715 [Candidatus Riflebacteria bacterium]|nr:hypothetical protein [Candidatus Riflebacteria bacterium]
MRPLGQLEDPFLAAVATLCRGLLHFLSGGKAAMMLEPGSFGRSFRVGRILGIRLSVHWSLLVIAALAILRGAPYGLWILGAHVCMALLGTLSILWHELAHALTARLLGYPTLQIELHAFGGLAHIGRQMRPHHDLLVSIAGPASSLCLSALLMGLSRLAPGLWAPWMIFSLAEWNLAVGLFNLIPSPPLDGGRVLLAQFERRFGLPGLFWAYTIGLWTAAAAAAVALFLSQTIALVVLGLSCQTAHDGRKQTLERLGYMPAFPLRIAVPWPWRAWRDRRAVQDVTRQLDALVAEHAASLVRRGDAKTDPADEATATKRRES